MWQIESTYKARDVEEILDRLFYRPFGFVIARGSQALSLTPTNVTLASIVVGVLGGHLLYYTDAGLNAAGMLLLVLAEGMDSADGQLARMTDTRTRLGRILDGFGGNLIFISVYLHLCLRVMAAGGGPWVFLVAVAAGMSHSYQCAMADYYRNAYLYFVYGEEKSEIDRSPAVAEAYRRLSWKGDTVRKFLMRIYLNYTLQQESLAFHFLSLFREVRKRYGTGVPPWLQQEYAGRNRPMLKYYNILTTNTRMIALFCAVAVGTPWLYWAFELLVLNAILAGVTVRQAQINRSLLYLVLQEEA